METLPPNPRLLRHQLCVLLLTFSAYAAFHASRKPPTIVKPLLASSNHDDDVTTTTGGWPPFDGPLGAHRLGELDVSFLSSYALGMYLSGHLADRLDLRRFLLFGMLASAASTAAFGLAYWLQIHAFSFFVAVHIVSGLVQSVGWPCVVAVVGNWFDKSKRGLVMGVWNSNTSVGNILGSVMASSVLEFGWGWSFLLPAVLIAVVGVFVWAFLVVDARDLGFQLAAASAVEAEIEMNVARDVPAQEEVEQGNVEQLGLLGSKEDVDLGSTELAIGFMDAWRLPGVAPFAFCLFFSKLVAYTFLYWLPFYIRHNGVVLIMCVI